MEGFNKNDSKIENHSELQYEIARNGDAYFVTCKNKEKLLATAIEIFRKLNKSNIAPPYISKDLLEGEEVRPQGVFGMKLRQESRKGKDQNSFYLLIDNRNGQGQKEFQDELKKAVTDSVI